MGSANTKRQNSQRHESRETLSVYSLDSLDDDDDKEKKEASSFWRPWALTDVGASSQEEEEEDAEEDVDMKHLLDKPETTSSTLLLTKLVSNAKGLKNKEWAQRYKKTIEDAQKRYNSRNLSPEEKKKAKDSALFHFKKLQEIGLKKKS
jgi:hypothetical protein